MKNIIIVHSGRPGVLSRKRNVNGSVNNRSAKMNKRLVAIDNDYFIGRRVRKHGFETMERYTTWQDTSK